MIALLLFLFCLFIAIGTGILAGWSDIKGLKIENIYSVVVLGAFLVCYLLMWLLGRVDVFFSPFSHILSALIVFAVTAAMFAFNLLGAADSKLGTAFAAWVGLKGLFPFLFYMTLCGGLLAVFALGLQKWTPVKNPPEGSWIARVQAGESKVPYGVAIVLGALASFVNIGYFSSGVLGAFVQ